MSEINQDNRSFFENQKGKYAFAIILSALYGLCLGLFLSFSSLLEQDYIAILIFIILILGIAVLISLIGKHSTKAGKILFGLFLVFFIVTIFTPTHVRVLENAEWSICSSTISHLGVLMNQYQESHKGTFPDAKRWNDVIQENFGQDIATLFICPTSNDKGLNKCSYAMNPNAEPNSPPDVVLCFESETGWNQFGGAELINPENHDNNFFVLFTDYSTRVIKVKDIWKLNWGKQKEN